MNDWKTTQDNREPVAVEDLAILLDQLETVVCGPPGSVFTSEIIETLNSTAFSRNLRRYIEIEILDTFNGPAETEHGDSLHILTIKQASRIRELIEMIVLSILTASRISARQETERMKWGSATRKRATDDSF